MKVKWLSELFTKLKEKKPKKQKNKAKKEKKQIFKKSEKFGKYTRILIPVLAVIILVVAGVLIMCFIKFGGSKKQAFTFGNMPGGGNQFVMTEDMVVVSGVTSVGITEESFDVENLTTALEIEEVYVNSEEDITEGTKVLKLSEESVSEAREELEQTLKEADLAYRSGAIEYEQSKITAEYERDSLILSGQQAQSVYDETISSLTSSVERAQEELDQAKEDIAEYQSYVNDDSYKSYFKVDEYQAIYDETLSALVKKMDEWGVSWSQVTGQGGGQGSEEARVLASLYDALEVQRKDLDQAISEYEEAVRNAAFELQTLELKLPELENALTEAEINYKNQIFQAELTYQTSLSNAQSAESDYETAIEQAETTYESLKKDWEDAKENLELFESSVGDGYFYASGSGTILRTMVRAGRTLSSEGIIFMYSNPAEMTVTVSVDQANISSVKLGDSVYIQSSEFGGFEGIVTELNPVSNSDSRTNVTYSVTVQFSQDASAIGANESVTVIFGMDAEAIQNMISMSQNTMPEKGRMPEGQINGMD